MDQEIKLTLDPAFGTAAAAAHRAAEDSNYTWRVKA